MLDFENWHNSLHLQLYKFPIIIFTGKIAELQEGRERSQSLTHDRGKILHTAFRLALGPSWPQTQWITWPLCPEVICHVIGADHPSVGVTLCAQLYLSLPHSPRTKLLNSYNKTNQMHLISRIYFWNRTLHVSDSFSVCHRESSTVHTATGICQTGYAVCTVLDS